VFGAFALGNSFGKEREKKIGREREKNLKKNTEWRQLGSSSGFATQ
jgi:hypothetical protein